MDAYAEGIELATGVPFVFDRKRSRRLERILATHGPNGASTDDVRVRWLMETALAFGEAVDPKYGYSVSRFLTWLNAGRPRTRATDPPPPETEAHTMSRPITREEREKILEEERTFRDEIERRSGTMRASSPPPIALASAAVVAGADALGTALEGIGATRRPEDRQEGETEASYLERRRREQLARVASLTEDEAEGGT